MTIFLVRHGETIDNATQTFQMPKSPLSRNGNRQAEQLSQRLAQAKITDIICSDYLRTKETASFTVPFCLRGTRWFAGCDPWFCLSCTCCQSCFTWK